VEVHSLNGFIELNVIHVPTFGEDSSLGLKRVEFSSLVAGKKIVIPMHIGGIDVESEFELMKAL
jgi:hypothetical protein